jgi:hypothetical protein
LIFDNPPNASPETVWGNRADKILENNKAYFMTRLFIILAILLHQIAFGQINPKANSLFFNLPLDSSRKEIQKRLKADKNFKEYFGADTSDFTEKLFNTYLGRTLEKGLLKSQPDSIEIELTFGIAEHKVNKRVSKATKVQTILRVKYY